MDVLIAAASRHGSTTDVALAIAETLERAGHRVAVQRPEQVTDVARYDAVILGSAIYLGHWLAPMKALIDRAAAELVQRPVWLFSIGPIGVPPKPIELPADVPELMEKTRALEHRIFAGKLDRHQLAFGERLVMTAVRAEDGDYRPWGDLREWACDIGRALAREPGLAVAR
jgi:menaquinone-dependent protoporphyrinogen oxidase